MARVLIRVKEAEGSFRQELVFDGARNISYAPAAKSFDADIHEGRQAHVFDVEERDVDAALRELTQLNPGREVEVLTVIKSAVRPPGELVIKNVTKEGVTPF